MARALMGYVGNGIDQHLQVEVARLRRRVRELETELAALRTSEASLDNISDLHQADPSLDLELHQLAERSAPALA
jgi:hypothetical protein